MSQAIPSFLFGSLPTYQKQTSHLRGSPLDRTGRSSPYAARPATVRARIDATWLIGPNARCNALCLTVLLWAWTLIAPLHLPIARPAIPATSSASWRHLRLTANIFLQLSGSSACRPHVRRHLFSSCRSPASPSDGQHLPLVPNPPRSSGLCSLTISAGCQPDHSAMPSALAHDPQV